MRVDLCGDVHVGVAESVADDLEVFAVVECSRRVGVPHVVQLDPGVLRPGRPERIGQRPPESPGSPTPRQR